MKTLRDIITHHEREIAKCDSVERAMLYVGTAAGILAIACIVWLFNI